MDTAVPMPTSVNSSVAMTTPFGPARENGSIGGPSSSSSEVARRARSVADAVDVEVGVEVEVGWTQLTADRTGWR